MTAQHLKATSMFEEAEAKGRVFVRRSHLEIRMDMLKAVLEGSDVPTQIMYKANLSWITLLKHLKALLEREFLRETQTGSRKKYELTQKGLNWMRSYTKVVEEMQLNSIGTSAFTSRESDPHFKGAR